LTALVLGLLGTQRFQLDDNVVLSFLISAATDLPSGAVIVLVSSFLLAVAAFLRRLCLVGGG